jgi:hypothetical protein
MATPIVSRLTREYALLLGKYEVIEREIEYVVGPQRILDEIDRIDRDKRKMRIDLAEIAAQAMTLDPRWQRERVRPVYPRDRKPGALSRVVYGILRRAEIPLKTREIARLAAEQLGLEITQREVSKLEGAVANTLKRRVGKTIMIAEVKPIRWSIMPRDQVQTVFAPRECASPEARERRETAVPQQLMAFRRDSRPIVTVVPLHPSQSQTAESRA